MTRSQAQQLWPVVKAWGDCEIIQLRVLSSCGGPPSPWQEYDGQSPNFLNENWEWRVNPKPREFWICGSQWFASYDLAYRWMTSLSKDCEIIHVTETP